MTRGGGRERNTRLAPAQAGATRSYAQMRSRLDGLRAADQRSVDRVYGVSGRPEHGYRWAPGR